MEKRESEIVEFKKSTKELKQGVISLVSMLNKHGRGTLYFGVLNDGTICGQIIGVNTKGDISREIKNHIRPNVVPSISITNIDGLDVIKVEVEDSNKPFSAYGKYYIRSDDEDLLMDNMSLEKFFVEKAINYSSWEQASSKHNYEDIDEDLLISYFNKSSDKGRLNYNYKDPKDALNKLGLLIGDELNNAGFYLFSKSKPLKMKLATFHTEERISFSDLKVYEGNIFECIDQGIAYISEKMNWPAKIEGFKRVEMPEIPLEAIREIVINSFVHMKVNDAILNEIYLTPSKIVIRNPGSIYKAIKPEQFASGEVGPILRNPLINMTLYKNGMIDSFATGFERTFELCKKHSIEYDYVLSDDSFTFIFYRPKAEILLKKHDDSNKENRKDQIIRKIKIKPSSTIDELAKGINVSTPTIARELKTLQDLGLIKRVGANKNGYWQVL